MALTEKKMRFVELYTAGPSAGNGTASLREAGYKPKDDNSAASMASRLLAEKDVRAYRDQLILDRQAAVVGYLNPWRDLLPAAQALQREAIEVARQAISQLQVEGEKGSTVDLGKVSWPIAGLIKAGLEAASTVEAYGLGKPISRSEVGEPGDFERNGLKATIAEIRESLELMRAAGLGGLLTTGIPEDVAFEEVEGPS